MAVLFSLPSFGQVDVKINSQDVTKILNKVERANTIKNHFRSADEIQLDSVKLFDPETSMTVPVSVDVYDYVNKQVSESISYSLDEGVLDAYDGRQTYTYDVDGRLMTTTNFFSDDLIPTWEPEGQQRNEYNAKGLLSKQVNCVHDGTQFVCEQEWDFEYLANDVVSKVTVSDYDSASMQYQPTFELRYLYDAMDQDTAIYSYSYDTMSMDWVLAVREVRKFNNGLLVESERLIFEPTSMRWIGLEKEIRSYDGENLIEVKSQDLDFATFQYETNGAELYSYDINNNLLSFGEQDYQNGVAAERDSNTLNYDYNVSSSDLIVPFEEIREDIPIFHHKLERSDYYSDADTNTLVFLDYVELVWSNAGTTSTDNVQDAQIEIYPNPVENNLTVELQQNWNPVRYRFVDMMGKSVVDLKWEGSYISTQQLGTGVFVLEVIGSNGELARKTVVKR